MTRPRMFLVPIVIGVVSLAALVTGLLGDGVYDLLSWIGLGLPVAAIVWSLARRRI